MGGWREGRERCSDGGWREGRERCSDGGEGGGGGNEGCVYKMGGSIRAGCLGEEAEKTPGLGVTTRSCLFHSLQTNNSVL